MTHPLSHALALLLPVALGVGPGVAPGPTGAPAGAAAVMPLAVAGVHGVARFAGDASYGEPAYPAAALEAVGARVQMLPGGARVIILGDTLRFTDFSPFFHLRGRTLQLASMVYRRGGRVYWPRDLFIHWLPTRFARHFKYRDGVLAMADASAARMARAAAAPIETVAPAASRSGGSAAPGAPGAAAPASATSKDPAPSSPADSAARARALNAHRLVVLDPGHGGRDPGRIGPDGVMEKTVTLAIAKRLAAVLRSRGYHVRMTRTTDTLISLADRPRMANKWKADYPEALFMSIHANAYTGHAEGYETYFLSQAKTQDERRVAAMENSAVKYETKAPGPKQDDISLILNNLKNNFYLHASDDLAEDVQKELSKFQPGPNRGVKQAGFRVLVGALMPAVLVETDFISDRKEERLLDTGSFQEKIAHGLADAIDDFFDSHEHLWRTAGR